MAKTMKDNLAKRVNNQAARITELEKIVRSLAAKVEGLEAGHKVLSQNFKKSCSALNELRVVSGSMDETITNNFRVLSNAAKRNAAQIKELQSDKKKPVKRTTRRTKKDEK